MLPLLARGVTVAAALAVGLACVSEVVDATHATAPAPAARPDLTIRAQAPDTDDTTDSDTTDSDDTSGAAPARSTSGPAPAPRQVAAPDPAGASRLLPQALTGPRLLSGRSDLVPEVARRNAMATAELARLLRDPSVTVSPQGHAYVVEPAPQRPGGGRAGSTERPQAEDTASGAATGPLETESAQSVTSAPLGSLPAAGASTAGADTFRLQSRPGASRTIFLDVDGADVSGTMWAQQGVTGPQPGFNQQGSDAATFDAAERAFVRQVWRQVAETYAPFDVNVTTQDPGRSAWFRSDTADTTYGSRVVLTSSTDVQTTLCGGCAGIAGLRTFGRVDSTAKLQPAWVFVTGWARTAPTVVAQTVAHEVGHNLGLGHDGQDGQEYSFGSRRWGPVMGGSTARAISQWSRGEYAGATNTEDDLAKITTNNLPLATDDHGDTGGTATALGSAAAYDVEGVIGTRGDVDTFRLDLSCATTLDARAQGIGAQSTLDLRLDLLSTNGTLLASDGPLTTHGATDLVTASPRSIGMDAAVSTTLSPGSYLLRVDGVGSGSATARDMLGWSDYGSLGRYRLTATGCATATDPSSSPAPDPSPTPGTTPTPTTPTPTTPPVTRAPATAPGAPTMRRVSPGARGRPVTVTVRWSAPATTGGSAIRSYTVAAHRVDRTGAVTRTLLARNVPAYTTTLRLKAPAGRYRFSVRAVNAVGPSAPSARSAVVTAR